MTPQPLPALAIFLLLFGLTAWGVGWLRRWLEARRVLDIPNERSLHAQPKPRGGGLVIILLTLLTALVSGIVSNRLSTAALFAVAGLLIAIVGWLDDRRSLRAGPRFLVQGLAAALVIAGLGWFQSIHIPLLGQVNLGWAGIPITFLWIMGLTNAFNFMDGIDGITGLVGAAAGVSWLAFSAFTALTFPLTFWISLALTAGCLGFLLHNWYPSRIFIGDACSTFLGFAFAILPLLQRETAAQAFLPAVAVVWIYIFDTGLTFLRRLIRREKVFSAHRSHLYQRLNLSGIPVTSIALLYGLLTLFGGVAAFLWLRGSPFAEWLMLPGMPILWILLAFYTRYVRQV